MDIPANFNQLRDIGLAMLKARLSGFHPIAPEATAAIDRLQWSMRTYEPSEYVLRHGERPKVCTLLLKGFLYRHKIVANGGRQIVALALPGDLLDVQQLTLSQADHNIQALTEATVANCRAEDVITCARTHSGIAIALWHLALIEASITREWIANIGRRDAQSRTAHLLCELAVRCDAAGLGAPDAFELPMTQEQLGDTLGLTAVHINRTLRSLEVRGAITRDKRSIAVTDWRALREIGDFSADYLHLRDDQHAFG